MQSIDQALPDLLQELLRGTQALTNESPVGKSKYLNVLLGIYRVSSLTLNEIHCLSLYLNTGAGMLDLTRKVIDYCVTIEYMIFRGKEEMADRFQKYFWVESHKEIQSFKSVGQGPEVWPEELSRRAKEAEEKFEALPQDIKKAKNSWIRDEKGDIGCTRMLSILKASGQLDDFNFSRLYRAYVLGCRQNHPSPFVVVDYVVPQDHKKADLDYRRKALCMAIFMHIRLTKRYIEEIRTVIPDAHKRTDDSIDKVFEKTESVLKEFEAQNSNKV